MHRSNSFELAINEIFHYNFPLSVTLIIVKKVYYCFIFLLHTITENLSVRKCHMALAFRFSFQY